MARYYVYVLKQGTVVAYVGKGSGKRNLVQSRKYGLPAEIIERFDSETKAFKAERKWIAELKPELNKCAGGNGGRVRRRRVVPDAWERNYNRIGPRRYVARLLLAVDQVRKGLVDPSKLEAIRLVANGCWS